MGEKDTLPDRETPRKIKLTHPDCHTHTWIYRDVVHSDTEQDKHKRFCCLAWIINRTRIALGLCYLSEWICCVWMLVWEILSVRVSLPLSECCVSVVCVPVSHCLCVDWLWSLIVWVRAFWCAHAGRLWIHGQYNDFNDCLGKIHVGFESEAEGLGEWKGKEFHHYAYNWTEIVLGWFSGSFEILFLLISTLSIESEPAFCYCVSIWSLGETTLVFLRIFYSLFLYLYLSKRKRN